MTRSKHAPAEPLAQQPSSGNGAFYAAVFLALAVVLAAHWPVLSAQALSIDDQQYLVENPLVRSPGWNSTRRFLGEVLRPSTVEGYYQPLAMISLMLDVAMGGSPENLTPFHRTNLALHLANTALLMGILWRLFSSTSAALLIALVLAIHPLSVEPVAWISERKTLLATFFALLSILAYLRHTRRPGRKSLVLSIVLYLAALLAKPTTLPLPILLLLLDIWPLKRLSARTAIEKAPYFVIAIGMAIITYLSQANTAIAALPGASSPARTPLVIAHNIGLYLTQFLWPVRVSGHYLFPANLSISEPAVLRGVIVTVLILTGLAVSLRYTRSLVVGFGIWFVMLLPTLQIVGFTDVIAADKYLYLPSIGIALALTWGLSRLLGNRNPALRRAVIGVALVVLPAEVVATRAAIRHWSDTETLYKHMLAIEPRDARIHSYLALHYAERGQADAANVHCTAAMRETPADDQYPVNVGTALARIGRGAEAVKYYQDVLKRFPDSAALHANFAGLQSELGNLEEALVHGRRAVELKPGLAEAHNNLANAYLTTGQLEEAVRSYRAALALRPDLADIHNNLGVALFQSDLEDEALREFDAAARLRPDYPDPHRNMALLYASRGQLPEARVACRNALKLEPKNPLNHVLMGDLLMHSGQPADARGVYMEALNLSPGLPGAERGLAGAEAALGGSQPGARP